MFLSEGIINNFIESIEEVDLMRIDALEEEEAYKYLASLYKKNYGASPAGTAIYLLRSKFSLGHEDFNKKFIPHNLI
ncbi:MAG: hypothetical protein LW817_00475 [Candidatus Caenarcaniphilales bacterium]|nr:hypothetical protein [Candidatus Caenarcaniphilales bacterium]